VFLAPPSSMRAALLALPEFLASKLAFG
jgi:hypothetical protein